MKVNTFITYGQPGVSHTLSFAIAIRSLLGRTLLRVPLRVRLRLRTPFFMMTWKQQLPRMGRGWRGLPTMPSKPTHARVLELCELLAEREPADRVRQRRRQRRRHDGVAPQNLDARVLPSIGSCASSRSSSRWRRALRRHEHDRRATIRAAAGSAAHLRRRRGRSSYDGAVRWIGLKLARL